MKKAKTFMATALLAVLTITFVGCGKTKFTKAFTGKCESPMERRIVGIGEDLDDLTADGDFFVGKKTDSMGNKTQYFYGADGSLRLTLTDTAYTTYEYHATEYGMYVVRTDSSYSGDATAKYTYYDYDFNVLVSESENSSSIFMTTDFLFVNNNYYQLDDEGKIKTSTEKDAGLSLNYKKNVARSVEKYDGRYYNLGSSAAYVYDENLELTAAYEIPEYMESRSSVVLLQNGNVLMQAREKVPNVSKKYDLEMDGERYLLHTFVLNVKKNTVKEVKVDYILVGNYHAVDGFGGANFDSMGLNPDLKAIYGVLPIKDKRYSETEADLEFVTLGGNGKIKSRIEKILIGQTFIPTIVEENRYICRDLSGAFHLLDESGKTLVISDNYILFNGGVYITDIGSGLTVHDVNMNTVKLYPSKLNPTKVPLCDEVVAVRYVENDDVKVDVYKNGSIMMTYTTGNGGVAALSDYGYEIRYVNDIEEYSEYYDLNGNVIARSSDNVRVYADGDIIRETTITETGTKTSYKIAVYVI